VSRAGRAVALHWTRSQHLVTDNMASLMVQGAARPAGADGAAASGAAPAAAGAAPQAAAGAAAPSTAGLDYSDHAGAVYLDRLLAGRQPKRIMHAQPDHEAVAGPAAEGAGARSGGGGGGGGGSDGGGPGGGAPAGAAEGHGGGRGPLEEWLLQSRPVDERQEAAAAAAGASTAAAAADAAASPQQLPHPQQRQPRRVSGAPARGVVVPPPRAPPRRLPEPRGPSAPRPHPFHLQPRHVKTNYKCPTPDGWRLHLVRTQLLRDGQEPAARQRNHPVRPVGKEGGCEGRRRRRRQRRRQRRHCSQALPRPPAPADSRPGVCPARERQRRRSAVGTAAPRRARAALPPRPPCRGAPSGPRAAAPAQAAPCLRTGQQRRALF
jgi:hypothetical protein